jgi:hypothetical protein
MMRMKTTLAILTLGVLSACTASYTQRETTGVEASAVRLDRDQTVFVAVPADGAYGGRVYAGSGRTVALKTAASFSRYARRVQVAATPTVARDELLAAARSVGARYLVVPSIAHWEQRATEWSGVPSRVSLGMATIDVATGHELRSGFLESRSAVMTLVRPNPDALVQHLVDRHVAEMYAAQSASP